MFCIPPPFTVWENIPALRFNHFFPAFLTPKHPSVQPGHKSDRPLSTGSRRETRDLGREKKSQRRRCPGKDGHTGEPRQHPHLARGHTEVPVGSTQAVPCLDPSHKSRSAPGSPGREQQICMRRQQQGDQCAFVSVPEAAPSCHVCCARDRIICCYKASISTQQQFIYGRRVIQADLRESRNASSQKDKKKKKKKVPVPAYGQGWGVLREQRCPCRVLWCTPPHLHGCSVW